jgi:hypothetical protein
MRGKLFALALGGGGEGDVVRPGTCPAWYYEGGWGNLSALALVRGELVCPGIRGGGQGSLLFPKIGFFINPDIGGWSFL